MSVLNCLHRHSEKFVRNSDITHNPPERIRSAFPFIWKHPPNRPAHNMIRATREEGTTLTGSPLTFLPVNTQHPCTASGDDRFLCIHNRDLFAGKGTLCNDTGEPPDQQPVTIDDCYRYPASLTVKSVPGSLSDCWSGALRSSYNGP